MRLRLRTYTAYSIASWIAWALLLALGGARGVRHRGHSVPLVFPGWVIG